MARLQSHFKNAVDDTQKELDFGILHAERALDKDGNARIEMRHSKNSTNLFTQIRNLRKKSIPN